MAHRLAFPRNTIVPLAIRAVEPGGGRLYAYDPASGEPTNPLLFARPSAPSLGYEVYAQVELLAIDATPLDGMKVPTSDTVWMRASFKDTLGRNVELLATEAIPGTLEQQQYGGVATNMYRCEFDEPVSWSIQPLAAWTRVDVRIDGTLVDSSLLATIALLDPCRFEIDEPTSPFLTVRVAPQRIERDGTLTSTPIHAAEKLGMAGWTLHWSGVDYCQAPIVPVRLEKNDTPIRIAKEMGVDQSAVERANPHLNPNRPSPGSLLHVPILLRATDPAPKRVHPSVALTWAEIVKGWTTLN